MKFFHDQYHVTNCGGSVLLGMVIYIFENDKRFYKVENG